MPEVRMRIHSVGFWQVQRGKRYRKQKHVIHSVPLRKLTQWQFGKGKNHSEMQRTRFRNLTWEITFEKTEKGTVVPVLVLKAN